VELSKARSGCPSRTSPRSSCVPGSRSQCRVCPGGTTQAAARIRPRLPPSREESSIRNRPPRLVAGAPLQNPSVLSRNLFFGWKNGPKHAVDVLRLQRLTDLSRHPVQGECGITGASWRVRTRPGLFELVLLCHHLSRGRHNPGHLHVLRPTPFAQASVAASACSEEMRQVGGTLRSYSFHWPAAMPLRCKNQPSALPPLRYQGT